MTRASNCKYRAVHTLFALRSKLWLHVLDPGAASRSPYAPPPSPPRRQALQWLVVFVSLMMHVAAFLSMRSRLRPCLIKDVYGNPSVDEYAIIR